MNKVRFAVVGVHSIAKHHIDGIRKLPQAELAAVCDDTPRPKVLFKTGCQIADGNLMRSYLHLLAHFASFLILRIRTRHRSLSHLW